MPDLTDQLGRPLRDLRISVMDRCNFRCPYCMPEDSYPEGFRFLPPDERLTFDEIERIARIAAGFGVTKLRLTGGEPLLRPNLAELVARLTQIDGVDDVALTTNGILLPRALPALRAAGLHRVTVSLDSLDPAIFARMSGGRRELETVLRAIDTAQAAGFPGGVKVNMVVQRGINDHEVPHLLARYRGTGVVVRFVEYMDVGTRNGWSQADVVRSAELLEQIDALWPLLPLTPTTRGEVARRYRFADGAGEIGFISSVSDPFCGDCSRARLSSDGKLYTCLFATTGTDLRALLRHAADDTALRDRLSRVWRQRTDRYSEERSQQRTTPAQRVEMNYIGG